MLRRFHGRELNNTQQLRISPPSNRSCNYIIGTYGSNIKKRWVYVSCLTDILKLLQRNGHTIILFHKRKKFNSSSFREIDVSAQASAIFAIFGRAVAIWRKLSKSTLLHLRGEKPKLSIERKTIKFPIKLWNASNFASMDG